MSRELVTRKQLRKIGFPKGEVTRTAMQLLRGIENMRHHEAVALLKALLAQPEKYLEDKQWHPLAQLLVISKPHDYPETIPLIEGNNHMRIFGEELIDPGAIEQIETAMKLPVTVAGALMPDAHVGYGLPIGGVLAVKDAVIPYGVGVDIGCRMALSIFDIPVKELNGSVGHFRKAILDSTCFGAGKGFAKSKRSEHQVLEDPLFKTNPLLASLHERAWEQLGSSGGGNHFVEFGIIRFEKDQPDLKLGAGDYVAFLSHSGSRGLGARIADYYTKLAKSLCKLPKEAANLAYLSLGSEAGAEYWAAMELAGQYASANHEIIHNKIYDYFSVKPLAKVENHHNFAWKEVHFGEEVIVHRKGATPAGKGVLGFIPGSMSTSGFLVRGKENASSLHSAAHGAGRRLSRNAAIQTLQRDELNQILNEKGITLIGAGMDEAPMAYKDIHAVMAAQTELVETAGIFQPQIVRMTHDGSRED